ncbi:sugar ABC transporter substrate-binding protein [Domibacillus sp. PGB-M46]|uniref:ABC transporter substrate-binding protein n=1 Tax=Domibacillus sp. PGB-M46 TaxID=2910255 RepID=UPI001F59D450|nr:sugar ABC transporter substrate-binding protein [Domibacillus sp. PGB-M46]MCI2256946.1 sugar ABC transporter substrate-binding protein [Domibacillus sp. PGB-M46]
MKKRSLFVLLFSMLFVLLAACGSGGGGGGGGGSENSEGADKTEVIGSDSKDATELTFWTFQELHINLFEDAVTRWNKEFPDRPIKLKAEAYPYDNMHNNLLLALQSGKGAPDIVDIELGRFPNYLQGEPQLLPMNEYVDPVRDEFIESRFDIYSKDGQNYGLPTHVGATVVFYNKEIMDKAGVDIDSIETWDDYIAAGKQVVEKTDAVMTTLETGDYWSYWPLIKQQGSDFFDENGKLTLANETNVKTLEFMHGLIHDEKIAEITPGGTHHEEEYYGFMNDGGAASVIMPMWYMGRFTDYMQDLKGKMVIRPMPKWTEDGNRSAGAGGTGTAVTNQTEHPELAKEFLAYAKLSEEGNLALWKIMGFDPPRWTVWENPAIKEDNKYYQYFGTDIFDTLLSIKDEIDSINITEKNPLVQEQLSTNVFNNVLRAENQSPEEALKEAEAAISSN